MATNQTTNYQLNQWEPTDAVQRVEFNQDNAKVDAALKALSDQVVQKANQSALNTVISAVNQKADASTLSSLSQTVAELSGQVAACGNCKIEFFTYTGTGTSGSGNPTRITFSRPPLFFLLLGGTSLDSAWAAGSKSMPYLYVIYTQNNMTFEVNWNKNRVSFYSSQADWQFNESKTKYYVFALSVEKEKKTPPGPVGPGGTKSAQCRGIDTMLYEIMRQPE
mgnify:CR=1 FL=1